VEHKAVENKDDAPPLHGKHVARVMKQQRPSIIINNKEPPTVTNVQDTITLADWYFELGKAHRMDAMGDYSTVIDWDKMDIPACIQAFQQAVTHYQRALDDVHHNHVDEIPSLTTRLSLALAESFLAESLVSSFQTTMALHHFEHAVQQYKLVLDESKTLSPSQEELMDWEILYANTMGHTATLLLTADTTTSNSGGNGAFLEQEDVSGLLQSAARAETLLEEATAIYTKTLKTAAAATTTTTTTGHQDATLVYQLQLAHLWHNLGTAKMITSTVGRAIAVMEQARETFEMVIPQLSSFSYHDVEDAIVGMADLLVNLSDAYLQAGNYPNAKERYKNAMEWYKRHGVDPPVDYTDAIAQSEELLVEMERQLQEYHASLMGGGSSSHGKIQITEDPRRLIANEPLYEPDHRYEADLYAAIGSIELSNGQAELAMTHFVKAVDMYQDIGGEERAIADVCLNMAMALFLLGQFDESAEKQFQALDIYEKVVGKGKNPLIMLEDSTTTGLGKPTKIGNQEANAENENAFRAQLVNMETLQQTLANKTLNEEL
jgi:tetratricopeptide (TPR) repeat protein